LWITLLHLLKRGSTILSGWEKADTNNLLTLNKIAYDS